MENGSKVKRNILEFRSSTNHDSSANSNPCPQKVLEPHYFFFSTRTQTVYNQLIQGIQGQSPLIVLTGPAGVGKTELVHRISADLGQQYRFIFAHNYFASFEELVEPLCIHFGVPTADRTNPRISESLFRYFDSFNGLTAGFVFVVDNAEELAPELLTNLVELIDHREQDGRNICFQIVLIGLPGLENTFQKIDLNDLVLKKTVWASLNNFDPIDVERFIRFRLDSDGSKTGSSYTQDAIKLIAGYSNGNLRLINALCNLALFSASLEEDQCISAAIIESAACQCLLKEASPDECDPKDGSLDVSGVADDIKSMDLVPNPVIAERPDSIADIHERESLSQALMARYAELNIPVVGDKETPDKQKTKYQQYSPVLSVERYLIRYRDSIAGAAVLVVLLMFFAANGPSVDIPVTEQKASTGQPEVPLKTTQIAPPPRLKTENFLDFVFEFSPAPKSTHIEPKKLNQSIASIEHTELNEPNESTESSLGMSLDQALKKARMQMQNNFLTTPSGNNALQSYRQILSVYPGQDEALYGVYKIKRTYQRWGLNAELRQDLLLAKEYYSRALKAMPGDRVITTALDHIEKQLSIRKSYDPY